MANPQCRQTLDSEQCVGEEGHPGWHFFGNNVRMLPDGRVMFAVPKPAFVEIAEEAQDWPLWELTADGPPRLVPGEQLLIGDAYTTQLGYGVGEVDPLKLPLPPIATNADWSAKDRQIEWVRANFTPGMLAKLYKFSYDADGLRRDKCDEIIRKG